MILSLWSGHTDRSRALAQCVAASFDALGWKRDYAAALMGITPAQLSRQLAGIEPMNVFRLANLGDAFDREYDRRRAGLRGAVVLEAPDLSLIRGACALGSRRMVSFTTPMPLRAVKEA